MDWRPYIHSDPNVLLGKPVVKGTRLAVDFLLRLLAAGWTEQQVLESYPTLTPEALQAALAFAGETPSYGVNITDPRIEQVHLTE